MIDYILVFSPLCYIVCSTECKAKRAKCDSRDLTPRRSNKYNFAITPVNLESKFQIDSRQIPGSNRPLHTSAHSELIIAINRRERPVDNSWFKIMSTTKSLFLLKWRENLSCGGGFLIGTSIDEIEKNAVDEKQAEINPHKR